MKEYSGRVIKKGKAEGIALVSREPVSFFGCVDSKTGVITENGHILEGKSIRDKVLVFPYGKGSTVGSYALYRLKKNNCAPKAIVNSECEAIVAVGAIISNIPCIDKIPIDEINSGDRVLIDDNKIVVELVKKK